MIVAAAVYLILIIHGQAIWSLPKPYSSIVACEEAGALWDSGGPPEVGSRGHYCLPGPITTKGGFWQ
jgi:hypothetical protein